MNEFKPISFEQLIKERDHAEDLADKLAAAIAKIAGVEIGEHSDFNSPWNNALVVAVGLQRRLNELESALKDARGNGD
jgi:hypothetical protein